MLNPDAQASLKQNFRAVQELELHIQRSLIFRILYFVNILLEIHYAEYKSMKDLVEKYYGLPGGSLVEA